MISAVGLIFVGTALPEEILFRSLIQNLLMLRFGANTRTLLIAAFIFGWPISITDRSPCRTGAT